MEHCCIDLPFNQGIEGLRKRLEDLPRKRNIVPSEIYLNPKWVGSVGKTIAIIIWGKAISIPVWYKDQTKPDKVEVCYPKGKEHPKKHCHANGKDPLVNKHS
jgi:hypothetical protein